MLEWLDERSEPKTMLAVDVIKELKLPELRLALEYLQAEIKENRAFKPFYACWVDSALRAIAG